MDISNKTLAMFLVAAIVVSLAGTIFSLNRLNGASGTGFVINPQGNATLNVLTSASLIFAVNTVDFGSGNVNSSGGFDNCTMYIWNNATIYQSGCTGFNALNAAGDTFILMNNGNTYLNVTLNSTSDASTFIGGDPVKRAFQYNVTNNESGSCIGTLYASAWTNVATTDTVICSNLSYLTGSRTLRIGIRVVIPLNATQGARTATFTATGV